jgi:hypothetical protein
MGTGGRTITATFDLHGATPGSGDLVVTNADGTTFTLAALTVWVFFGRYRRYS